MGRESDSKGLYVNQTDIDNYTQIKKSLDNTYTPDFSPLDSDDEKKNASDFLSKLNDEDKYNILREELAKTDQDLVRSMLKIPKTQIDFDLKNYDLKNFFSLNQNETNAFDTKTQKININFNRFFMAKKNTGESEYTFFAKYPVISRIGCLGEGEEKVAEIKNTLSPMYITLQHEMSHLLDYNEVDDIKEFYSKTVPGDPYKYSSETPHSRLLDPMQQGKTQHNLGEQRAILSGKYSELYLRKTNKEPIRYSHMRMDDSNVFFEPVEKIKKKILEGRSQIELDNDKMTLGFNDYYPDNSTIFDVVKIDQENNLDIRLTKVSLLPKFPQTVDKLKDIKFNRSPNDKKYAYRLEYFYKGYTSPDRIDKLIKKHDLSATADLTKTENKLRILANIIMKSKENAASEEEDYYYNAFKSVINQETGKYTKENEEGKIENIIKLLEEYKSS